MRLSFRAHFDGKVIVPDEPVGTLPVNEPLVAELSTVAVSSPGMVEAQAAYQRLIARAIPNLQIPPEDLRRERIYGDD